VWRSDTKLPRSPHPNSPILCSIFYPPELRGLSMAAGTSQHALSLLVMHGPLHQSAPPVNLFSASPDLRISNGRDAGHGSY